MRRKKYQKVVSTDSIGWLGNPYQFIDLYEKYFKDRTFNGVEMIAFKPEQRIRNFISFLKKRKIKTVSFHSKTGGENRLPPKYGIIMTFVNLFIYGVEKLTKEFKKIDFLSHTPYLENESIKRFIIKNKPQTIWIENHNYGIKGIEEAIKLIQFYRQNNINAKGMLDLYHYLAKVPINELINNWQNIVSEIEKYTKWFTGIHFPIGSRIEDNLPIEKISDEMLITFSKRIVPKIERLVIENQQAGLGLFFSTKKMIKEQKKRNRINFLRLKKAGIL